MERMNGLHLQSKSVEAKPRRLTFNGNSNPAIDGGGGGGDEANPTVNNSSFPQIKANK